MINTVIYSADSPLDKAAEIIKNGGLVAFPTETVYGLGANALDTNAAKKIYMAKGRPSDNPLIIHLSSAEDVQKYAYVNDEFKILAKNFMPGPITVVLRKKDIIPSTVTGGLDTVAVRIPSNEIARRLILKSGVPIAAPSANISGRPSCTSAAHVVEDMSGRIDAIIDGGDSEIGLESTIVAIIGDMTLKLLRPGAITLEMLEAAGFKVSVDKAVTEKLCENEKPMAPGMKYRHYSPRANVTLVDGDKQRVTEFLINKSNEYGCAVILNEEEKCLSGKYAVFMGKHDDAKAEAKVLFAALRSFDSHPEIKEIYARVPKKENLGLAIYNRMLKASGYTIIKID